MATVVDTYLVYRIIKSLVTPFKDWKAYKLGIIDEKGNMLIKRDDFKTKDQFASYTLLDQLIANVKKLLAKLPFGTSRLANITAAMWLIKEAGSLEELNDQQVIDLSEKFSLFLPLLNEEMTAGSGAIAGIGVGPSGEPGISKSSQNSYKFANSRVFIVPTDKFIKARTVKNPFHKYSKYVGDDEEGENIRQFGRSNPGASIILQDRQTGAMMYLRKGKT